MSKSNLKTKKLIGIALNNSRGKTVKIEVGLLKIHPLYKRRFDNKRTFLVHTEIEIKKGQKVEITPTRPISRRKSWKVLE